MDETSLRKALDRLYRGPPSEFVKVRTDLARSLTAAGDRETAKLVKAARKPDRIAAALNLTVLEDPEPIDAVFAAFDAAERAQRGGDGDRWRELVADYRERVQAATRAVVANGLLPSDATTSRRIAQALSAAAADDAARKHILAGHVTTLDQDTDPLAALGLTDISASQTHAPRANEPHPPREHTAAAKREEAAAAKREEAAAAKREEAAAAKREEAAAAKREAARAKREEAEQRREAAARAKREQAARRAIAKATERIDALERERRRIDEALAEARAGLARATAEIARNA